MSNVSEKVIENMFNHLTKSYSEDEARELLIQKYPEAEDEIKNYVVTKVEMGKVVSVSEPDVDTVDADEPATDLKTAVKAKVAKTPKTKAAKAPKAKRESKVDQARALFNESADKSRRAVIDLFITKMSMSKAMASTYYYMVKS